jgi:hypothetical protein
MQAVDPFQHPQEGVRLSPRVELTGAQLFGFDPPDPAPASSEARRLRPSLERLHPVARVVRWFLSAADRLGLPLVVLAGDRELPGLPVGRVLTVACKPTQMPRLDRMLARGADRYGVLMTARRVDAHRSVYVFAARDAAGSVDRVEVEVLGAAACFGVPYLSAHQLLQGRTRRRGHARPDVVISALFDFLGLYLAQGGVRDEAAARLATVLEQRPAQTRSALGEIFGTSAANALADALREPDRSRLFRIARRTRRALLGHALLTTPLETLAHLARHALRSSRRRILGTPHSGPALHSFASTPARTAIQAPRERARKSA